MFLILQFNTLDVLLERARQKNEPAHVDYMSQKIFDYSPPFAHVNLLIPKDIRSFDPTKITSWCKVIITHSKKHKGVRVEDIKPPGPGQYHLLLPCTRDQILIINNFLEHILSHQQDTYCSITMKNALLSWGMLKLSPRCLRPLLLPCPNYKQNGWHCSELCLYLLQKAGILSKNIYPFLLTPTELFLIVHHHPLRIQDTPVGCPFPNNGVDGWEFHMKTPPPEIHEGNCLAIQYYANYHEGLPSSAV